MWQLLKSTAEKYPLAIVSGSDFNKIVGQMGGDMEELLITFDYVFAENGLCGYHGREPLPDQVIRNFPRKRTMIFAKTVVECAYWKCYSVFILIMTTYC